GPAEGSPGRRPPSGAPPRRDRHPGHPPGRRPVRRRRDAGRRPRRRPGAADRRRPGHPRPPGRGHHQPRGGHPYPGRLPRAARRPRPARARPGRRGVDEAVGLRAGARPRRPRHRPGDGATGRGGRHGDGHDRHPRHGGPPHRRLHARRPRRAPQGAPRHRSGAAGDARPHRGRRQGPRRHRLTRAAGEGCLRRAADRGAPEEEGRRRRLRPEPGDPHGRPRVPDGRLARSPADRAGPRAGRPELPRRRLLGGADAVRHPPRRAAPARRRGHPRAGLRAVRRRLVRLLHAPAGRAPGQRRLLPPLPRHHVL
ncbi:MAG: Proline dehydrogenase, partial [uncultured Blastococcus sp.]